jgi:hypothetical protein
MVERNMTCCRLLEVAVHSETPNTLTVCLRCDNDEMLQLANSSSLVDLDREREHLLELQRENLDSYGNSVYHVVSHGHAIQPPPPPPSPPPPPLMWSARNNSSSTLHSTSVSPLLVVQSFSPPTLSIPPPRRPGWRALAPNERLRIRLLSVIVEVGSTRWIELGTRGGERACCQAC